MSLTEGRKPNLHDVLRFYQRTVVGERETCLSDFLMFLMARRCVQIEGDSGSGKTVIKDATMALAPQGSVYTWSLSSETAPFYDQDRINAVKFIDFPEFNKAAPKSVVSLATEIMKDLGERKDSSRRVTNMVGYSTGGDAVREMRITSKPFHSTVATETDITIGDEIRRRVVTITTKADREQTKMVVLHKAKARTFPLMEPDMTTLESAVLQGYVNKIVGLSDKKIIFVNPAAELIAESVPSKFTVARTMVDYLLDACEAVTRFYLPERQVYGDGKVFVTPSDCYEAFRAYWPVFLNGVLKLDQTKKDILRAFQSELESVKASEIQQRLRATGLTPTKASITAQLKALVDAGYLDYSEEGGKSSKYMLAQDWKHAAGITNWSSVCDYAAKVMQKHYPEVAEEYVRRHCNSPSVTDPVTGTTVYLRGVVAPEQPPEELPAPKGLDAYALGGNGAAEGIIVSIVKKLSASDDKGARFDDVVDTGIRAGIPQKTVDIIINKLLDSKTVKEPILGRLVPA